MDPNALTKDSLEAGESKRGKVVNRIVRDNSVSDATDLLFHLR